MEKQYTDRQYRAFSRIAYYDLPKLQYYRDSGNSSPIALDQLLSQKQKNELMKDFGVTAEEISTWKIAAMHNTNDTNGFSACVIETGNHQAAVAFRGSELDSNQVLTDWLSADAGLLTKTETEQQREVDRFLKKNQDMLREYNLSMTGHSLGGNLAEYATLVSHRYGLDARIKDCVSLDGPGFSAEFIDAHAADIARMNSRMQHYRWSLVGGLMYDIPGADYKYVQVEPGKDQTTLEKHGLKYANQFENGDSFKLDKNGSGFIPELLRVGSWVVDYKLDGLEARMVLLALNYATTGLVAIVTSSDRRAATKEANANREFYLDTELFLELAESHRGLPERLRHLAVLMKNERLEPLKQVSIARNVYVNLLIKNLINSIISTYNDMEALVSKITSKYHVLSKCADTLEDVIDYMEDTATDFNTIEELAQKTIEDWSSKNGKNGLIGEALHSFIEYIDNRIVVREAQTERSGRNGENGVHQ